MKKNDQEKTKKKKKEEQSNEIKPDSVATEKKKKRSQEEVDECTHDCSSCGCCCGEQEMDEEQYKKAIDDLIDEVYDEEDEAEFEAWWENFYEQNEKQKIKLAQEMIEQGSASEVFIDFMYDLVEEINHIMRTMHAKQEWYAFCDHFKTFQPEIYTELKNSIVYYHLTMEINDNNWGKVSPLIDEFVESLEETSMYYLEIEEMLIYANQLSLVRQLVEGIRKKMNEFEEMLDSDELMELEERASHYLIFETLEKGDLDRDKLFHELEDYGEFEEEWVDNFIYYLTRKIQRSWQPSDFILPKKQKGQKTKGKKRSPKVSEEEKQRIRENFYHLALEFVGYLRHVKNVPYLQAEIASYEIIECLLQKQLGTFTESKLSKQIIEMETPFDRDFMHIIEDISQQLKEESIQGDFPILYPDMLSVTSYILSLEDSIYPCAIYVQHIYDWLDFCVEKGFCTQDISIKIKANIKKLPYVFQKLCASTHDIYPGVQEDIERIWTL